MGTGGMAHMPTRARPSEGGPGFGLLHNHLCLPAPVGLLEGTPQGAGPHSPWRMARLRPHHDY